MARGPRRRAIRAATVATVAALIVPAVGHATTITVNSSGDAFATGTLCTLRQAIFAADNRVPKGGCPAGSGKDTIVIIVPTVTLAIPGAGENADATGDLDVLGDMTIESGVGHTTIDAAHLDRVLDVVAGSVVLQDLILTNGTAPNGADGSGTLLRDPTTLAGNNGIAAESGGGIRNAGSLTLNDVTVSGNATGHGGTGATVAGGVPPGDEGLGGTGGAGGAGGGIASTGTLTITASTITNNATGVGGAGGDATSGAATTGTGPIGGGGDGGTGGDGGGVFSAGTTTITGSTISSNHSGTGGTAGDGTGSAGLGATSGTAGIGGPGSGGGGGNGGDGAGVAAGAGTLTISGSLVTGNTGGGGGTGGEGIGGAGGHGTSTASGGDGGSAFGGFGGTGGQGSGLATTTSTATINATSDTLTADIAGNGGNGGSALGGAGGISDAATGGDGGNATGGRGGSNGSGGGAAEVAGKLNVIADTLDANAVPLTAPAGGTATPGSQQSAGGVGGVATAGMPGALGGGGGLNGANVADSIITANTPDQCESPGTGVQGHNVQFPAGGTCSGLTADPHLRPLADNGGPTKTFALVAGGPAIDEVPSAGAACPAVDQRGVGRPHGAACDAGAYELAAPGVVSQSAATTPTSVTLSAAVNPSQRATTVLFVFGTTALHGGATPTQTLIASASPSTVSASIPGLTPSTTYHFATIATNADGTTTASDTTFTTPALPPVPQNGASIAVSTKPQLTRLTLKPTAFLPVTKTHRTKRGTTITYTDSQAASTTFTVEHRTTGVRRGSSCVAAPKHPAKTKTRPKSCTRYVTAGGSFSHADRAGKNTVAWSGDLRGRPLAPGSYKLLARATRDKHTSATASHAFTIKQ